MIAKRAIKAGLGLMLGRRHERYGRLLNFNPRLDFVAGFGGPEVETVPIRVSKNELILPGLRAGVSGALLELGVQASAMSDFFDPALEFAAGDFADVQFIDRGANGTRFFNVTRLVAAAGAHSRVQLRGHLLSWNGEVARLYLCRERLLEEDRLLVVAPHPDDAEIAAYGLYSDMKATIVTLTAGDASKAYRNPGIFPGLSRALIATLRVWDSITVPRLGGVAMESALNLCYPDGRLSEMRKQPERDFRNDGEEPLDFDGLRRLNSPALISSGGGCTWRSLIADLHRVLTRTQPTVIVTPHPVLDSHSDHVTATAAVVEAMGMTELDRGRFFYTCIHNHRSELWPFGPLGSGVAHLPVLPAEGKQDSRFYSHALSPSRQLEKFIALEAMHDLREIAWPEKHTLSGAARRFRRELRALRHGLDPQPVNYLRRAVRPDEPFFVLDFNQVLKPPDSEQLRGSA